MGNYITTWLKSPQAISLYKTFVTGLYFENLDNLIALHQRKYEELQKIKKFMLRNMFV